MRCFEWRGSRSQLCSVASVIIKCLNDWINSYYLVIICQVQSQREECSDLCDCIYQLYSWFLRKLDIPVIRRLSGDKLKAVFITTPVYCTRVAWVALYFSSVLKATHTGRVLYPPLSAYCIDLAPGPPAPSLCSPSSSSLLPVFCSSANLCLWLTVQTLKNKLLLTSAAWNRCEDGRGFEVLRVLHGLNLCCTLRVILWSMYFSIFWWNFWWNPDYIRWSDMTKSLRFEHSLNQVIFASSKIVLPKERSCFPQESELRSVYCKSLNDLPYIPRIHDAMIRLKCSSSSAEFYFSVWIIYFPRDYIMFFVVVITSDWSNHSTLQQVEVLRPNKGFHKEKGGGG